MEKSMKNRDKYYEVMTKVRAAWDPSPVLKALDEEIMEKAKKGCSNLICDLYNEGLDYPWQVNAIVEELEGLGFLAYHLNKSDYCINIKWS